MVVSENATYVEVNTSKGVATLEITDEFGVVSKYVFSSGLPVGELFFGTEEAYLEKLNDFWSEQ